MNFKLITKIFIGTIFIIIYSLHLNVGYAMKFNSINKILFKNQGEIYSSVNMRSSTGENLKFSIDGESIKLISRDNGKVYWQHYCKSLKQCFVKIEEIKATDPKMTLWVVTNIGMTGTSYWSYDIIGPYGNEYVSYISSNNLQNAGYKYGQKETIVNNEKLFVSHHLVQKMGKNWADDQFFQVYWDKDAQWFAIAEVVACE